MIDGIAASRPTTYATGRASRPGPYWVTNSAMPTATGTAITIAITEMITVTQSSAATPKRRRPGLKSVEVRKFTLSSAMDGTDLTTRKNPTSSTTSTTNTEAPEVIRAK